MTADQLTRAYVDHTGKRTTMRLDAATWRAIDALASGTGTDWESWLNRVPVENTSRTTDVRKAVMEWLTQHERVKLSKAMGQPLKDDFGNLLTGDPMLMEATPLTDAELKADLKEHADMLSRATHEFRGFQIRTGYRQGRPCWWIINGVRGGAHLALPIPSFATRGKSLPPGAAGTTAGSDEEAAA